jgi:cell wall-associated NlpC family hydrolase
METHDQDRKIFDALARKFIREKADTAGEWMIRLALHFLGSPYGAGTLDKEGPEALVVNLRRFDCMTFVETVAALSRMFLSGLVTYEHFREILTVIRYRQGHLHGYASRLHYFSDWLFDNRRKGIVKNISRIAGGRPLSKKIHYMTQHPEQYPALEDPGVYRQIRAIERRLQRRVCYFIPQGILNKMEARIANGDLLAATTRIEGLDVTHVGIAVRRKQRIHFLHASSLAGEVIISEETLERYLAGSKDRSGIILARMVESATPE